MNQKRLKSMLHYDPRTGIFTLIQGPKHHPYLAGTVAGKLRQDGYYRIGIDKNRYMSHRLAWLYMTGEWPKGIIDHKDRNKSNNKWKNLRDTNKSMNMANSLLHPRNTSGFKGISFHKPSGLWHAIVVFQSRIISLKYHKTKELAAAAYDKAAKEIFKEFAYTNAQMKKERSK